MKQKKEKKENGKREKRKKEKKEKKVRKKKIQPCLLYTSPSPRDRQKSRMPSSA